jgi:hypothetical protein
MQFAEMGWQVTMGTLILPTLTKGVRGFAHLSKEFRNGTGTGGEIKETLKGIWEDGEPTVKTIGKLAKGTATFAREHPTIMKAAIALFAVGRAVSLIKTSKAISGLATLAKTTRTVIKSASRRGAISAADTAAETMIHNTGVGLQKRQGRLAKTMTGVGKGLGVTLGAAIAYEAAAVLDKRFEHLLDSAAGGPGKRPSWTDRIPRPWDAPHQNLQRVTGIDLPDPQQLLGMPGFHPKATRRRPAAPRMPKAVSTIAPRTPPVFAGAASGETTVIVPVTLDGRVITEVVARHTSGKANRR